MYLGQQGYSYRIQGNVDSGRLWAKSVILNEMRWTDTKRFLLLLLFNVVAGDTVVHVKDGRLPDGQYVGVHTSEIAANVIEKLFRPVSHDNWQDVSMFNSSVLRYLLLEGDYLADIPLRLPSLFESPPQISVLRTRRVSPG